MAGDAEEVSDKAAVAGTSGSNKEVDDMPPTYEEAKSLTTGEPVVKITSNDTKIEIGKDKEVDAGFQGLTKEELMKYANDPFWVRLRWILFILFWFIWVAMLAASIVIIIYAEKCPSPDPKEWWQKSPLYKVNVATFKDSDGNGEGDFAGVTEELDYLVKAGVGTVYLTSFFQSPQAVENEYDVQDYRQVNPDYGSLEDWKALVAALKERDQKVVIDFIPNHSSDQHAWFEMSIAKDPTYADFYIWNEGGGSGSPPNAWTVEGTDVPAWSWNDERGAWYLNQLGPKLPDLNLKNPAVVEELQKVLQFWIDTGVNGFVVHDIPIMVDPSESEENTRSTERQVEILKKFREIVDAETEDSGVPCVLYSELGESELETSALYGQNITGNNVGTLIHLPLSGNLLDDSKIDTTSDGVTLYDISAEALKDAFDSYMASLPPNAWPSFSVSATRFGPQLVDAMNMFKMLLPGTSLSHAGEELGLQRADWEAAKLQSKADHSHLNVYSLLANKLRHQEAILFGHVDINSTFVVNATDVFGMTRVKKGNPGYILLINFGDTEEVVDVSNTTNIPDNIRVMARSIIPGENLGVEDENTVTDEVKRFESKSVPILPKEGKIFTFVPKFGD